MISLVTWQQRLSELEDCPWPGPRPLSENDALLLIGRHDDCDSFAHEVLGHQLVVLHGESGVGKSSLLNAGLVKELNDRDFVPIVCSDWARDSSSPESTEDFVASKIADQLKDLGIESEYDGKTPIIDWLDDTYGDTCVLILDQFEELIRHQRAYFRRAVDWIVKLNRSYDLHVVISLRSEYLHQLKQLNREVRPFSQSTVDLEPIRDPDAIKAIIASGNREGEMRAITTEALELLAGEWQAAQQADFRSGDIGLLHLQGALYALYDRAERGTIDHKHVQVMLDAAAAREDNLFVLGIEESVTRRLALCEAACVGVAPEDSLDEALIVGTRAAVQRTVSHLSSGGYKLDREAWDLARLALERELRVLGSVELSKAERALRAMYGRSADSTEGDLLTVDRRTIAREAELVLAPPAQEGSRLRDLGLEVSPWAADPEGVSAGALLGFSPSDVLVEELRRAAFALEWLEGAWLVRATSPTPEETRVSLIHDGFGAALEAWAHSDDLGPAPALTLLTGAQGEVFDWTREERWPEFDGGNVGHTFVNLRWRNCAVRVSLRNVVFANCDLRGTRFENCRFEGVVFLNCLLDGATFGDCVIVGATTPETDLDQFTKGGMPSFADLNPSLRARTSLSHYRRADFGGRLYSVTSGISVTDRKDNETVVLTWVPQTGGLVMYGGRLSSLMVRNCTFEADGALSLRHIAGSSLDVTEQGAAKIDIFGGSVRGFSVSRRRGKVREQGDIHVTVTNTVLANTWFDAGLTGTATIGSSQVWQLINVSDADKFQVEISDCTRFGVVNIGAGRATGRLADVGEARIEDRKELEHQAGLMAYRRDPALLELAGQ